MAKVDRRVKHHKKTKLYARIMLWLSLPLFVLGAIFTAIQLTNQVNALNQIHRVQSEFAFQGVQKTLTPMMQNPDSYENLPQLKKSLEKVRALYRVGAISLYSILENKPLFLSDNDAWTPADREAIEENLYYNKKHGQFSYSLKIDKQSKQLVAYIPLKGSEEDDLYVARVFFPLSDIVTAISTSRWTLGTMLFFIVLIGFIIGQGLARSIVRPISILNQATLEIMHGNLDQHITINTGDEIEGLAERFNQMRHALKEMQRKAQDANPLTGLPGNTGIYHELQKRITERQKFVIFHCDLDRFKVFNDHFGLAQGDKAIKKTADFLRKMVKEKGAPDDFVGHQGGDDFVIITRPHRAKELADSVCQFFKTGVTLHLYSKDEYDKGFTMQLDRRRQTETGETVMVPFPLLSISMAGISNSKQDFADYADCMARVAPVKKEVKKIVESNFLIVE